MKKRILSFFIIFTILICNFAVVAFADGEDNNVKWWEFICSFFSDSYYIDNIAADPDQLINYWDTTPGKLQIINRLFTGANAPQDSVTLIPKIMAVNGLIEASERRCMVAELSRSQLQSIYDSFNDYWVNGSATVRNGNLEDYHLTLSNGSTLHGGFGTLAGAGPAVTNRNVGDAAEREHCISFVPSGSLSSGNGDVYIYNGSLYFPPVIFVTTYGTVLHNNQTLDTGIYIVLNGSQLLMVDSSYFGNKWCLFYSSSDHVDRVGRYVYNDSGFSNITTIYKVIDNGSTLYADQYRYTPDFSYDDILDLLSKSIGNHIVIDGQQVDPINITIDDNVPFEDDKTVVVVPVDQPDKPVFLSPTEYNNYVDSHDIYDTDNTTNNIVDNDTVNNITNIYNTYITNNNSSGGYDDTNLMTKLDTIINRLNDISNKIKTFVFAPDISFDIGNLLGVDDLFNYDDLEFDWKTLVQTKLPILAQASEVVRAFEEADSPLQIEFDVPLPGSNNTVNFALDFTWYDNNTIAGKSGREYVREGLSYIVYVVAFIALYRRTDKLFADY